MRLTCNVFIIFLNILSNVAVRIIAFIEKIAFFFFSLKLFIQHGNLSFLENIKKFPIKPTWVDNSRKLFLNF